MQLIELWETYLLQLDSDEDGPPLMPAGIQAEADASARRAQTKASLVAENVAEAEGRHSEEGAPSLSGTTAIEGDDSMRASEDIVRAGRSGEAHE